MTELRPTRRRVLAALGGCVVGTGAFAAVPPRRISATLETYRWVLSLDRHDPPHAPDVADMDPSAREAVRAAIDGQYVSADPPDAVRQLFSVHRETYVRYEGTFYRLDPTLPIYEVWVEPVDASTATNARTRDELERCIDPNPNVYRTPPLKRRDDPSRTYAVDPQLRDCIERTPFVELGEGYYRYHVSVDDPGTPYTITATRVSAATVAGLEGPVVDGADALPRTREALRAATERTLRRQSLPDGVRALASDYDYVRFGDRFYELDLGRPGATPIRMDVTVTDRESREFGPAWLTLSVTNVGGETVELLTGAPKPFGVLRGETEGGSDITLWSPAYEASRVVGTQAGRVTGVAAVGLSTTLTPGETRTTRYAVRRNPGRLDAGVYDVRDGFGIRSIQGETPFPYDLRLRIA